MLRILAGLIAAALATSASAASLVEVGSTDLAGFTQGSFIAAQGRYAYVTNANANAFVVLDLSNPVAPAEIGRLTGATGALAAQGRYVYTSNGAIVDVGNPTAPVVAGQTGTGGSQLTVSGNLVYYAAWDGLTIVDVTQPAAPVQVGHVTLPSPSMDVALSGPASTACTADTFALLIGLDGVLRVVNVTSPAAARLVGQLAFADGEGHGVATQGAVAFATTWPRDDLGDAMSGTLHAVDLKDPANPQLVSVRQQAKAPGRVVLASGYAYIAEAAVGMNKTYTALSVVDVHVPAAMVEVARNATTISVDVALDGSYAYVPQYVYGKRVVVYQAYAPATPGGI